MNLTPALWLATLVVCVVVATGIGAYRSGKRAGNAERCDRHSHAERVAAERLEPPMHDGPPARVSPADFRNSLIWEEEPEGWGGPH